VGESRIFSCFWEEFCFLWVFYPSGMKTELRTLLFRFQGRVLGYGPWDWKVTITCGGQADHEEDTGTWWLKYQP